MDQQHIDWIGLAMKLLMALVFWWLVAREMRSFARNCDERDAAWASKEQDACLASMDSRLARLETDLARPGADVAVLKLDLARLKKSLLESRAAAASIRARSAWHVAFFKYD